MKGFQDFANDYCDKINDLRDDLYKNDEADDGAASLTDIIGNMINYPEHLIRLYHEWLFNNFDIKPKE